MHPDEFEVRPLAFPVLGMTHGVYRKGAKMPLALAATTRHAVLVDRAFTADEKEAHARRREFRALEVERGEDLYRDAAIGGGR